VYRTCTTCLYCRGDERDEVIKAAKQDVIREMTAWLKTHLE
jgi:hypothetical protein